MNVAKRASFGVIVAVGVLDGSTAHAAEGLTNYLPGATSGEPIAISLKPGVYAQMDNYAGWGKLVDGKGHNIPARFSSEATSLFITWASPYRILGAQYGASVFQYFASHAADTRDLGGRKTRANGFYNTLIEPITLSWKIDDRLYVSVSQIVGIPDGQFRSSNGVRDQSSYANNFWTYEPSIAIAYLSNGWTISANNFYDIYTRNRKTDYHSGQAYFLDWGVTKTLGKITFGVAGDYTLQTTDDRHAGAVVGQGNRAEHVLVGPMVGYNFGRFSANIRYLANAQTRNDVAVSFVHLTLSTKF